MMCKSKLVIKLIKTHNTAPFILFKLHALWPLSDVFIQSPMKVESQQIM